jgi:hypothetical protein
MRILVDENIPRVTVEELRRLLITTDTGFRHHRHETHAGILIVRLRQPNQQKIHSRVVRAMSQTDELEWPGRLVIVRDTVQAVYR